MSDESIEAALNKLETSEPGIDYTPMPTVTTEEPKKKEYSAEKEGLEAAAKEVTRSREERGITDAGPDRSWRWITGDRAGQPMDQKFTLTESQGADGLIAARAQDVNAKFASAEDVANKIEAVRQEYAQGQQPFDPNAQPQVEQPQAQQPAEQQDPNDAIRQALENPHVRQALEAEVQQVEQARAAYAQQARQAAQMAGASLLATFPELANVPTDQLGTAIASIAQVNPQRAQAINQHLERTSALLNMASKAQEAQQEIASQRMQQFHQAEDSKFEAAIANENPETVRAVKENVRDVLEKEYGITKDELRQLWETQPLMRTVQVQRLLYDITKAKLAERNIATKLDRSVPPVQRPGTSQPYSDSGVDAALARFNKDPNPKNAADLLTARRIARR